MSGGGWWWLVGGWLVVADWLVVLGLNQGFFLELSPDRRVYTMPATFGAACYNRDPQLNIVFFVITDYIITTNWTLVDGCKNNVDK